MTFSYTLLADAVVTALEPYNFAEDHIIYYIVNFKCKFLKALPQ